MKKMSFLVIGLLLMSIVAMSGCADNKTSDNTAPAEENAGNMSANNTMPPGGENQGQMPSGNATMRGVKKSVLKLSTLGVFITFIGITILTHLLINISLPIAALFGALVTATGPSVVGPIIRNIGICHRVAKILEFESVLNDAVSVILTALVFEWITAEISGTGAVIFMLQRVGMGLIIGSLCGFILRWFFTRGISISKQPARLFTLTFIFACYVLSETIGNESGILAVAVFGIIMGSTEFPQKKMIEEFNNNLAVLMISLIFILLAAMLKFWYIMKKRLYNMGRSKELKAVEIREKNIVKDLNHKISRKIVDVALYNGCGIKLENLKGIRKLNSKIGDAGKGEKNKSKNRIREKNRDKNRSKEISKNSLKSKRTSEKQSWSSEYSLNSWSFQQLQQFIEYKARLRGVEVVYIDPHGTILESLSFGLPVLSFPDEKHIEQENNATVIEEEGYGKRMSYLAEPETILACIRGILEKEEYYKKTRRLRELAEELDGPATVRRFLEEKVKERFNENRKKNRKWKN